MPEQTTRSIIVGAGVDEVFAAWTFNELSPRQTEVTVTLQFAVPGVAGGEKAARLLSDPEETLARDLRRFKAYVEGRLTAAR